MKLGTTYPVTDLGADPGVLRAFAQGVEDLGYDDLYLSEHVIGADLKARPDWRPYNPTAAGFGPPLYDYTYPFLEPFVAFGFLAAVTKQVTLGTGVMVMGMRQTVLFAKQAAIADVLSGGRLRLGIGSGWNDVEYEAMGVDFRTRGRRVEEQITLLRALWTQQVVTFEGRWHRVMAAGINPLPIQRPIPLWFGGQSEPVADRTGRLGDGYYPGGRADSSGARRIERVRSIARAAGRDPAQIAMMAAVTQGPREPEAMVADALAWQAIGTTHLTARTSCYPFTWQPGLSASSSTWVKRGTVDQHLEALLRFKKAWELASARPPKPS